MPSLEYYSLAEAFFHFKSVALKHNFYREEIERMEESIRKMDPLQDDPELITKHMGGAKLHEGI